MNFLELAKRVRQETGETGTGPSTVLNQTGRMADIVSWTQQAWTDIQALHEDWGFLWKQTTFNTNASTDTYAVASDFNIVYEDRDGVRVYCDGTWTPQVPFNRAQSDMFLTTRGKPTRFTILPTKLFRPIPLPDGVYTFSLDYYSVPVVLAADADTPAIDSDLHMIIVARAMMDHAAFFDEPRIAWAQQLYNARLSAMERRYLPAMEFGDPLV